MRVLLDASWWASWSSSWCEKCLQSTFSGRPEVSYISLLAALEYWWHSWIIFLIDFSLCIFTYVWFPSESMSLHTSSRQALWFPLKLFEKLENRRCHTLPMNRPGFLPGNVNTTRFWRHSMSCNLILGNRFPIDFDRVVFDSVVAENRIFFKICKPHLLYYWLPRDHLHGIAS